MISSKVKVVNSAGLQMHPAGTLGKEAMKFKALITFRLGESIANAKSVLSVLGACVKCGDEIELSCEGEDEKEALDHLVKVISEGLGEE